jgi:branched-chain amino acid transport system ATP-binding protein
MALLSTEKLTIRFGGLVAVDEVSFAVEKGETFSIIGPNGSGKTTIFNLISGFYKPNSGRILFKGQPIQDLRPYRIAFLGIARTFQNVRLFKKMTVLDNALVGHHCRITSNFFDDLLHTPRQHREEKAVRDKAIELLNMFDLERYLTEKAENLPYGDQRKLEIVRGLAAEPELILLDEPAAGMNPHETENLIHLIGRIKDLGVTVVLVEHDMKVVMEISDRIFVLDYGKQIAEGTPDEIKNDPKVIEAYLGQETDRAGENRHAEA